MKKGFYIAFIAFLALQSCNNEDSWDCLKSLGDTVTEERSIGVFDRVFLKDKINLEYYYSESYYVEVEFGENIVHHIKTKRDGNSLYISNEATCNWVRSLKEIPLVRIYAPTLSYLENTSSANITFVDSLKSLDFLYEQRLSNGEVFMLFNTDSARVYAHTGYTGITLAGRTKNAGLYNASVGQFDASRLQSDITTVNNTSLQDILCVANTYLFGEINMSGNIRYSGDPENVDTSINGSGQVLPQ